MRGRHTDTEAETRESTVVAMVRVVAVAAVVEAVVATGWDRSTSPCGSHID